MAQNHYEWGAERAEVKKKETKGGIYEAIGLDYMNPKMDALSQKVESLVINPTTTIVAIQPGCEV